MNSSPDWLPPKIEFSGEWHVFINVLYSVFERNLKKSPKPMLGEYVVFHDNRKLESDREEGFWHITTQKDASTGERLPDLQRSRRLTWIRPIIEHCDSPLVRCFDYADGKGRVRSYLWLFDHDFVVVLQKQDRGHTKIARLITAYYIDGERGRHQLEKRYRERL